MIVAALFLGFCQILCTLCLCLWIRSTVAHKQAEIEARAEDLYRQWFTQPAPDKPHKFALLVHEAGTVIGSAAAQSIMSSLQADKSHVARQANMLSDEIQAVQNPLVGLLAGGKRGKGAALMRLAELLGSGLGQNHGSGSGSGTSDIQKRLDKGG
jgi:hypothetical protein